MKENIIKMLEESIDLNKRLMSEFPEIIMQAVELMTLTYHLSASSYLIAFVFITYFIYCGATLKIPSIYLSFLSIEKI